MSKPPNDAEQLRGSVVRCGGRSGRSVKIGKELGSGMALEPEGGAQLERSSSAGVRAIRCKSIITALAKTSASARVAAAC